MASGKPYHDENTLRELYCDRRLGIEEIAERFDVSPSTIWTWLDKNGIETSTWDPPEERFEDGYTVNEETGCWEWDGSKDRGDYGSIGVEGGSVGAHRFSYRLHKGEIPGGLFVCHTCDNPPCVNPDHLYAGTPEDNAQDAVEAGDWPQPFGEQSPGSKLTEEKVIEMRDLYRTGDYTYDDLTERFGVSLGTVSRSITGSGWPHVEGAVEFDWKERSAHRGEDHYGSKLTEADVREIRERYDAEDISMAALGEDYGITASSVNDILKRKSWAHVE